MDDIVCYCKRVTRGTILRAVRDGARTLADVQRLTGAGTGDRCRELNPKGVCCHADIRALLPGSARDTGPGSPGDAAAACCCGGPRDDRD